MDLGFPKIRVNFNGYRLKTKIQDVNWSNFYHINEDNETNGLLKIKQNGVTEQLILDDIKKEYLIGTGKNCDIRIGGSSQDILYGKIKYVTDIGWVIKSLYLNIEKKEGIYLSIREIAKKHMKKDSVTRDENTGTNHNGESNELIK